MVECRDLEEAEDQFQMALRTHLQNIDILIQLHDSRLYSLEKNFQQELKTMQHDFHSEKDSMLQKFKQEKKELVAVIETIEHDENAREAEVREMTVISTLKSLLCGLLWHRLSFPLSS